ncbi:hypothetical protein RRG08_001074 [Elysia crispata]|uniref:Uncharacterized protein n=1 Tax=Elysia crispata TaxID=231223 RepID=A0AAE1E5M9_9GAST|nr:hypothetical protein RRG08_001074 [Elysia crispata]
MTRCRKITGDALALTLTHPKAVVTQPTRDPHMVYCNNHFQPASSPGDYIPCLVNGVASDRPELAINVRGMLINRPNHLGRECVQTDRTLTFLEVWHQKKRPAQVVIMAFLDRQGQQWLGHDIAKQMSVERGIKERATRTFPNKD